MGSTTEFAGKSVAFHTLGCKLNFSETSALSRQLEGEGFVKKPFDEQADVYVINTCSVTENADKECRHLVRRIRRQAPESMVVITGCYAQLKPKEISEIEGVHLVLGAAEKFNLTAHLRELLRDGGVRVHACDIAEVQGFHASYSVADRTRSFLKVQDGCDYTCAFCTIPLARGHSRSDSIENVVCNAEALAAQGVREIVLTGINLGDFGKGADGGKRREENFYELLQALDEVAGIDRYRISSIEPNLLSEDIIRFVAQSKRVMPHFHIPLQSGSDAILAAMRRRYRSALYEDRVAQIKAEMPHACIGVDVITGFPGEGEAEFRETFDFLHRIEASYFHVFTYSERTHTLAASLPGAVPVAQRQDRNKVLRQLSYQKMQYFTEQHRGQERPVLWERAPHGELMEGYSDNYIRVQAPYDAGRANKISFWRL